MEDAVVEEEEGEAGGEAAGDPEADRAGEESLKKWMEEGL